MARRRDDGPGAGPKTGSNPQLMQDAVRESEAPKAGVTWLQARKAGEGMILQFGGR